MTPLFSAEFESAIHKIRADFPQKMADVTCVDLSSPHAAKVIEHWLHTLPAHDLGKILASSCHTTVTDLIAGLHEQKYFVIHPEKTHQKLLVVDMSPAAPGETSKEILLRHEVGHCVTHEGCVNGIIEERHDQLRLITDLRKNKMTSEIAADVFGALYALHDNKITVQDIRDLSQMRAINTWLHDDVIHASCRALDALTIIAQDKSFIRGMTPASIAGLADAFARKFTAEPKDLISLVKSVRESRELFINGACPQDAMEGLSILCVSTAKNSASHYLSARILNEMFKQADADCFVGEYWSEVRKIAAQPHLDQDAPPANTIKMRGTYMLEAKP